MAVVSAAALGVLATAGTAALGVAGLALAMLALLNAPGGVDDSEVAGLLARIAVAGAALLTTARLLERGRRPVLRLGAGVGAGVAASALGAVAALAVVVLGRMLVGRGVSDSLLVAYATLFALVSTVAVATVVAFSWTLARIGGVTVGYGAGGVAWLLWMAILHFSATPPLPLELLRGDVLLEAVSGSGGTPTPRYDVLLVLDPGDLASRRLARAAQPLMSSTPRFDVAVGIAVVSSDPSAYRVLQAPTTDRAATALALRRVDAMPVAGAPGSYGPALVDFATGKGALWRSSTLRAITLVTRVPPGRPQLRLGGEPLTDLPMGFPIIPRAIKAITPREIRLPTQPLPAGAVTLQLLTRRAAADERRAWNGWTFGTGGAVMTGAGRELERAVDELTGAPPASEVELAKAHRPLLRFNRGEIRRPTDVDAFLAARDHAGRPVHALCKGGGGCSPVDDAYDLRPRVGDSSKVLRLGAADPVREVIYYHPVTSTDGARLHLDYWIFFPFNDSPSLPAAMCLSGISVADVTCFDHQGDWEGVTVTLKREGDGWTEDSVAYAGHEWVYRYSWPVLERAGATKDGHPVVWVARGSHAAYPRSCGKAVHRSCRQPHTDIPDGPRDGNVEWEGNRRCDNCVVPMPLTRTGRPATWLAFGGRWGPSKCTAIVRLCTLASGPKSPYYQKRWANPGGGTRDDHLIEAAPRGPA